MSKTNLLVVYGTLKKGFANHAQLANAHYLGRDTLRQISLYDIGPYPGARMEASEGIEVEVYAITPQKLVLLDEFEEYTPTDPSHSLYTRETVDTRFGAAWVYIYQGSVIDRVRQGSGSWHP